MRIVLYQPEIPQNTCGIIRTCAGLGLSIDIIYPIGFIFNIISPTSEIKRIIMDYKCIVLTHNSWADFLCSLHDERVILFSPFGSINFNDFVFKHDDILVFGRESTGVDDNVFEEVDLVLTIPMKSGNRSFNVMSSVSMVLGKIT